MIIFITKVVNQRTFFFPHLAQCSLTCGGGVQTRKAHCVDLNGRVIADSNCPAEERVLRQSCHMESCPRWEVGEWTPVNHIVLFSPSIVVFRLLFDQFFFLKRI